MSNSILKESTFTPQVFAKTFIEANHRRYGKLVAILENLIRNGIIVAVSSSWKKNVYENIEAYDQEEKDELLVLLKDLDSRNKIAVYPTSKKISNEQDIKVIIAEMNKRRSFDFAVATTADDIFDVIDKLSYKNYADDGAKIKKQTAKNIEKILAPVVAYSEIVQIFDPYFKVDEKRFFTVLELICKNLGDKHGINSRAAINIHTSVKSLLTRDKEFHWKLAENWSKRIKNLEEKYKHVITIKIWEETTKNKWHDRWLITNQCGVFMGKGSDVGDWTDATWGLLNWEELSEISSKFIENRNYYSYIGEINANGILKHGIPRYVTVYISPEERKKKKNTPINLKERMAKLRETNKKP